MVIKVIGNKLRHDPANFRNLLRDLRATLKDGGDDAQQSLQAVVELLAAHFGSDVCSLYQLDAAHRELYLRATRGLRPEAIGRTVLRIGEGLVGSIAESRRLLALECAQNDDRFVFRPETGEEIYQSFLGVPLIRARSLLGVLVVQHREAHGYSDEEIEDCETVAQFLSEMLFRASDGPILRQEGRPQSSLRLSAVPLSPGLAVGPVVLHLKHIVIRRWRSTDPGPEIVRVRGALQQVQDALEALLDQPAAVRDAEVQELLEADLMLARDKGWRERIEENIGQGLSAEAAVQNVREELRARMQAVSNDYIKARLLDLDDLCYRLLAELTGEQPRSLSESLPAGAILVCRSLGSAELLQVGQTGLAGLVVFDATPASHLAIIANSLKLPALGQMTEALNEVHEGDRVILDALSGQLIARPSASVLAKFESHLAARRTRQSEQRRHLGQPCQSRDGVPMRVMANAGMLLDLEDIAGIDSIGIGLYRTEMAFLVRTKLPSVEEQARLYRRVYDHMADRPVVFRTLDIGSDKKLSYLEGHRTEANPALGWRAIRLSLDQPNLLRDQLRALLMAADGRVLRIMFPMISEVEEFEAARKLLDDVLSCHSAEGGTAPERLLVGAMIEVPALLWDLERLLMQVDFASVGTNDLFQFLNAADRNNPKTHDRFEALKAANLRLLTRIATMAGHSEKPISVCGEMAGTSLGVIALVGCGYRAFSMSAARIAQIKSVLNALDAGMVEARVQTLSRLPAGSVREEIAELARDFGLDPDPPI